MPKPFIVHEGRKYYEFNGYHRARDGRFLHRVLYEQSNGPVPEGHHVHHKDGDRANNALENLESKDGRQHIADHMRGRVFYPKAALDAAAEWRKTDAGKEFMREQGVRNAHHLRQQREFDCECCGAKYLTVDTGFNRFCSNKCRAKHRRDSGVDDVKAQCAHCGAEFSKNKHSSKEHCGLSCSRKAWAATAAGRDHFERLGRAKADRKE